MGEVSRLLVASPRPRLMETFFLILFSSLIGIDAPYSLFYIFNIIISYSIIILQMTVVVSCGHWGNHLYGYSSIHVDDSWLTYCFNGVLFFFFSSAPHVLFSISSVPCILFCVKFFTMEILASPLTCSFLHSSPQILSCFVHLIFFWCILSLDILLFITLYCYSPYLMLQYSTIVIQATSGIIRVWDAVICLLLHQLSFIISSCRLLFIRLSIQDDIQEYILSYQSKSWHVCHTSLGWLWHIVAWLGQVGHLLDVGSLIILSSSCSVMNMILWHDYYLFSMDSAEVGWHPSSVSPILVSFLSFIFSGMMVLV